MLRLRTTCIAALAFCAGAAQAQIISFDEVVRLADASARERTQAAALISVRRADAAVLAAQAPFEWGHSGNLQWRRQLEYVAQAGALTSQTVYRFNFTSSLQFDRLFENGIRVQPGVLLQRGDQATTSLLGSSSTIPMVSLDVPLNGSLGSPAESLRLQAARRGREAVEWDVQRARQVHLHRAATLAWSWLATRERARVLQASLDDAVAAFESKEKLAGRGEIPQIEVARAGAQVATRKLEIQELRQTEDELRASLTLLLSAPGAPAQVFDGVQGSFPRAMEKLSVGDLVQAAMQARPDVLRAKERVEAAKLGLRIADRQAANRLSFVATHESFGLSWAMPLGSSRANAIQGDAQSEMEAADLALREIEQEVARGIQADVQRIRAAQQGIEAMEAVERDLQGVVQALSRNAERGDPARRDLLSNALEARVAVSMRLTGLRLALATAIADLRLHAGQIPGAEGDVAAKVALFRGVQ